MAKWRDLLGMNARSAHYLRLNKQQSRHIADDKWDTKRFLIKHKIPTPKILAHFTSANQVEEFAWEKLTEGFVIKPVEGLGGGGIVIVRKAGKKPGEFLLMDGGKMSAQDLKLHTRDIVEGRYSRNNLADEAFIEERVKIHPKFLKFAVGGTPDVRVIVFNKVPVMAMLRVPTAESHGKSNLHQGAVGLGIDMATGITTHGVWHDGPIKYFPGSSRKVNGILVPFWTLVLQTAVKIQFKRPGLAYFGVDILLDKDEGPMVIEINDQPGLAIQIANRAGLKRRLERVEGLEIDTEEKGVKVAKALFASKFSDRVGVGDKAVVAIFETVRVRPHKGKRAEVAVKIDSGAFSSSIDRALAEELGLLRPEHILWEKKFKSALGMQTREVIEVDFKLKGRRVKARASVTNRKGLRRRMIIGRRDLKDFLVDPAIVKIRK